MLSAPLSLRMRDGDNPSGHSDVVSPSRSIVTIIILDHRDWPRLSEFSHQVLSIQYFFTCDNKGLQDSPATQILFVWVMFGPLLGLLFRSIVNRKIHTAADNDGRQ